VAEKKDVLWKARKHFTKHVVNSGSRGQDSHSAAKRD
jgi:hypothetical protein